MKKLVVLFWIIFSMGNLAGATPVPDTAWTWKNPSTAILHTYSVIMGQFTWDQAHDQVMGLGAGYYLATITSAEEQLALESGLAGLTGEFWLGGIQEPENDPAQGWRWADTNETFSYTNWKEGEPNDWGDWDEHHLGTWSAFGWQWNDEHGSANIKGYILESHDPIDPIANPEPGTMLLLGFGLIGLAGIGRTGKNRLKQLAKGD